MNTDIKQNKIVEEALDRLLGLTNSGVYYHTRQYDTFKSLNNISLSIAFLGTVLGFLSLINFYPVATSILISSPILGMTAMIPAFVWKWGEKAEIHRKSSQMFLDLAEELSTVLPKDKTQETYSKFQKRFHLIKRDCPDSKQLLSLISGFQAQHAEGRSVPIVKEISWTRNFLSNFFSFPTFTMHLMQKILEKEKED